jgi:hypothetical protein
VNTDSNDATIDATADQPSAPTTTPAGNPSRAAILAHLQQHPGDTVHGVVAALGGSVEAVGCTLSQLGVRGVLRKTPRAKRPGEARATCGWVLAPEPPPPAPRVPREGWWTDRTDLGVRLDTDIAREIGITPQAVTLQRRALGIPRAPRQRRAAPPTPGEIVAAFGSPPKHRTTDAGADHPPGEVAFFAGLVDRMLSLHPAATHTTLALWLGVHQTQLTRWVQTGAPPAWVLEAMAATLGVEIVVSASGVVVRDAAPASAEVSQARLRRALNTFGWGPRVGHIAFHAAEHALGWQLGDGVVVTPWMGRDVPTDPHQALRDIEVYRKLDEVPS